MVFNPGRGVGLRNVGSYQVSGHPYMTGAIMAADTQAVVNLPFVAKTVTVQASGTSVRLRVHFAETGSTTGNVVGGFHFWPLDTSGDAIEFNTKCTQIWVSCLQGDGITSGFHLVADLTGIDAGNMYALTGTGITD